MTATSDKSVGDEFGRLAWKSRLAFAGRVRGSLVGFFAKGRSEGKELVVPSGSSYQHNIPLIWARSAVISCVSEKGWLSFGLMEFIGAEVLISCSIRQRYTIGSKVVGRVLF
jgi:hypothetical protein